MKSAKMLAKFFFAQMMLALLFCVVLFGVRYRASPVESMRILFTYHGGTKWPYGYSELKFLSIKVGDTMEVAREKLRPDGRIQYARDGSQTWHYTGMRRDGAAYFARIVYFDRDGRVAKKESYYNRHGTIPGVDWGENIRAPGAP